MLGLFDSLHHVLLVCPILYDFYNLSTPPSMGFPEVLGERPTGDLQFNLSVCLMIDSRYQHLFPSNTGGSLSIDDWTRYLNLSIKKHIAKNNFSAFKKKYLHLVLPQTSGISHFGFLAIKAGWGVCSLGFEAGLLSTYF